MKKTRKRITATLCCVIMLFATLVGFSGCSQNTGDVVEITIKFPKSLVVNSLAYPEISDARSFFEGVIADYTKHKNNTVKITFEAFEAGCEEQAVTNTFGTSTAADILYDDFFNMLSYIHSGNAVPLDDVLDAEQTDDLQSRYVDSCKMNGKLYALPFLARQNILIYNKQLLRACDIEVAGDDKFVIENWPIEKWTETLDTLAQKLHTPEVLEKGIKEGSYPMMMYAKDNQGDTHIMTLLRSFGSNLLNSDNRFALASDEKAVAALDWIQKGVTRGWYMPLPYEKTISACSSKFKVDELAFYNFNLGSSLYDAVTAVDGKTKYGFVNYPGGDGGKCTFFCDGFEVFDNKDSRKLEIAKDFIRYIYSTEKWLDCSAGCIPVSKKVMNEYKNEILMLDEYDKNAVNAVDFLHGLPNWQGTPTSVRSVFYKQITTLLTKKAGGGFFVTPAQCAANLDKVLNDAINEGYNNSKLHV